MFGCIFSVINEFVQATAESVLALIFISQTSNIHLFEKKLQNFVKNAFFISKIAENKYILISLERAVSCLSWNHYSNPL